MKITIVGELPEYKTMLELEVFQEALEITYIDGSDFSHDPVYIGKTQLKQIIGFLNALYRDLE